MCVCMCEIGAGDTVSLLIADLCDSVFATIFCNCGCCYFVREVLLVLVVEIRWMCLRRCASVKIMYIVVLALCTV